LDFASSVNERQVAKATADFSLLIGCEEDPALSLLAGTTGTSETMDVGFTVAGKTNLDNVSDIGEVHSSCCDVGGEEDTGFSVAEVVCCTGTLCLRELGMDFKSAKTSEWSVALEATAELVHDGRGECDLCSAVEICDSLERTGFTRIRGLVALQDKLVQRRHDVLETGEVDELLGYSLMCRLLVLADTLGEVKTGAERLADKINDVAGYGRGKHHVLAIDDLWIWEVLPDLVDFRRETVVEQAISLVHDQCVQVWGLDAGVGVAENVIQSSWSTDHQVASLTAGLVKHSSLLSSTDGYLHHDAGSLCDLLRLDCDLLSQFSSG
jgi:hypothetical protein